MSFSLSEYTKINVGWGFAALSQIPKSPRWFQGDSFAAEGELRGGEGRTRGRGKRERKGEWGREGKGGS